jgi:hypothetical protein
MQGITYRLITVALFVSALVLGGCSDFDEMKGQRMLVQAEGLLEKGDEGAAEAALAELVAKYPSTQAALEGQKQLQQIHSARERREKMAFSKVLDSYGQVLNGYRSMYSEYPRSIASLDESDYFFDSYYLDEITPEDYQVYLFLKNDGSGYRIWCVRDSSERGFVIDATDKKLVSFEKAKVVENIKGRFKAATWDEKVVVLSSL